MDNNDKKEGLFDGLLTLLIFPALIENAT